PKDPETLAAVSEKFGLKPESGNLEGLVNYGFLSFVVKPLASLMLKVLLTINRVIGNYGWSIVVLTIVLNMFFFPLRWKSSVSMILQTALTPSTADPVQKKMAYFMPLLFTGMFFIYAPAGLVLYWIVANLVGIAQQMIINRLNPPSTPAATNTAGRGGGTLES